MFLKNKNEIAHKSPEGYYVVGENECYTTDNFEGEEITDSQAEGFLLDHFPEIIEMVRKIDGVRVECDHSINKDN